MTGSEPLSFTTYLSAREVACPRSELLALATNALLGRFASKTLFSLIMLSNCSGVKKLGRAGARAMGSRLWRAGDGSLASSRFESSELDAAGC